DFLGPLPKTERGNEHILMIVDQFTKWVECIPLPSQSAELTAQAVVNDFFSRFGYPFQILSDQGRNFESKLFSALCEAMQIHKTKTTPYRPSTNGQVERFNRTLMDAVRCYVDGCQKNWDLCLAQIAGALRSSVNRSTGLTPNKMMLGREVNQPVDLLFPMKPTSDVSPHQYVAELQNSLKLAHETARKYLKSSQEVMKRNYDLKVFTRTYDKGDLVYLLDTATIKGQAKKLGHPWKGPGIIVTKFTPFLYRVKLKNAVFTTNHDRLKPCRDRKLPGWLEKFRDNFQEILKKQQPDDSVGTHVPVYCMCRKPDTGDLMVQCDSCTEWFHGTCVGVTATEALKMKTYRCPPCSPRLRAKQQS
ncbi:MAG: DDE-type integrase/transposase/recombinase, partial [Candidatus Thiodiazotropha sp.]